MHRIFYELLLGISASRPLSMDRARQYMYVYKTACMYMLKKYIYMDVYIYIYIYIYIYNICMHTQVCVIYAPYSFASTLILYLLYVYIHIYMLYVICIINFIDYKIYISISSH